MTTSPLTARLIRGGLVILNETGNPRVIAFQYNPDTLTRSFQIQGVGAEGGDRSEALRLKAPPVETIKLDAEFDLTDDLEKGAADALKDGLHPRLAVLETIIYPSSARVQLNQIMASLGTLEIAPAEMPLVLFIWSEKRILPVRLTEFNITEEAFDTKLNPIRARVSLGMRVLTNHDLPAGHRGTDIFFAHHSQKEVLAGKYRTNSLIDLGVRRIP
jgi:hypothetical protein